MGHYFGSPHTPLYKPDIMVFDGRPSHRRCNGRRCLYQSFHPMHDHSDYLNVICDDIRRAPCARSAGTPAPTPAPPQPTPAPTPAPSQPTPAPTPAPPQPTPTPLPPGMWLDL